MPFLKQENNDESGGPLFLELNMHPSNLDFFVVTLTVHLPFGVSSVGSAIDGEI